MAKKTFYITTAIDYPNAKPHIGHAYEKIVADALARWHEQLGEDVFFLTGTDENSQKIEKAAAAQKKKPKEFLDAMVPYFKDLCKKLNIRNDAFIRTTDAQHKKTAQALFQTVLDKGLIYKGTYKGLYCVGCEAFITEKELAEGLCPTHQTKPQELEEESYFFKLSAFQDKLLAHIKKHPELILPDHKRNEILNRLKEPLRDLSVSRTSLKWGIQLPNDPKHVLYVWFDALSNYVSALGYPAGAQYKKYWPCNVHVIGKDITWFHTVIWPCILLAADIPLPTTVHSHGFVNLKGEKLSKSRGVVVDPIKLVDDYGVDAVRYFFLKEIPAGEDGDFSYETLLERNNADLADSLGNLVQRTTVMLHKYFDGSIPKPGTFEEEDEDLIAASNIFEHTNKLMQTFAWHHAIDKVWDFIRACNKYVNDTEPWKIKDEKRLATVLYCLAESLRIISIYTYPFIPETAEKIAQQLGQKLQKFDKAKFSKTTKGKVGKPQILFTKKELAAEAQDPFSQLNLKVAKVESAEPHPEADKLIVLQIDCGEKRQLVAGLKEYYKPEELVGKQIVIVSNLKPAKLRGKESQGMLLAAEKGKAVKVVEAQGKPGDQVFVEGIEPGTEQITIDDFFKIKLTTKGKKVVYDGKALKTKKAPLAVDIADNAKVR